MVTELFLVEVLENNLAFEAVQYMHMVEELCETHKFDPTYFDTFITGPLYVEFVKLMYERIKPLNSHEASRYLTLSVAQFKSHTPVKREKEFILNYWETKWVTNNMGLSVSEQDEKYAKHIWKHYTKHFHLFKEVTEKGLADFKAGILGSQPTQVITNVTMIEQIKYVDFNVFIKQLQYNYLIENTVLSFKYSMKEQLDYLNKEILTNLIVLNKDEKKAYLNRLKYELENHQQNVWSSADRLEKWYRKYDSPQEDDLYFKTINNVIYKILNSAKPNFKEVHQEGYNEDTEQIQDEFYNYYYGYFINVALDFIGKQIEEVDSLLKKHSTEAVLSPKLKTNLNVPQLSYLFKMLMDINPPIFDIKTKKELYQFIEANFTTKGKEDAGPTFTKLNNLYSDVDKATANFWAVKLKKMLEDARKI